MIVPMGASEEVAVVTVKPSVKAQRDERASPRKPKVRTRDSSSKEESFEV